MRIVGIPLLLIACGSSVLFGQEMPPTQPACSASNLGEENPATAKLIQEFWRAFDNALKHDDKKQIAVMIDYPLSVAFSSGRVLEVRSQRQFLREYERVFPKSYKRMLLRYSAECINRVGVNGFSIAHGQIWFDRYPSGAVKIFSINVVVYPEE